MALRWPRLLNPTQLCQILQCQKNPLTALHIFREAKLKYPTYRHNGPVYATMIGILGNVDRITEMKDVINEMKEGSCECKDATFAAAINTYARHGLVNEAVNLFKSIPHFICVNWTQSFNTLLQIMIKENQLEAAHDLFLENCFGWEVKSRLPSLNLLMEALCQKGHSELALQILQEMDFQGCYPNRESYRILMKGLCEDGRLNEATHLLYSMFWRISQKGSGEDIVVYRTLLDTLCDHNQIQEAAEILRKILKKGLRAPTRRLKNADQIELGDTLDVEVTKRLINDCLMRSGIPSSGSFSAMAVDLFNENKIIDAEKVIAQMQTKGYKPSDSIYEAKIAALCRESKLEEAMEVIDEEIVKDNAVPSCRAYSILVKGLCHHGHSKLGIGYLETMSKKLGRVADKQTYEIVLDGLCNEGDFIEASKILEQMLIKSHKPRAEIFGMVIKGLCSIGRQYEAVMWLEEMVSRGILPEVPVWSFLVSSVCCEVSGIEFFSSSTN